MMHGKKELSLYVHIPFCRAKCAYCDFLSFGGSGTQQQTRYVSALCNEIMAYKAFAKDYVVRTVFIGGGTPSYLDTSLMEQVMQAVYHTFSVEACAEITIEGNPDSLTGDKLKRYCNMGINRLSIGLQSANDKTLKLLGRVHCYDQFTAAYCLAREAGFSNINIDLMSGLPGEGEKAYMDTLEKILKLSPEHISAYSLIVEEGTPLADNHELLSLLPTEEEDRAIYAATKKRLKRNGYERYEISNYAKKGMECRHNLVYWTGGEYLGAGLGASSYLTLAGEEGAKKLRFRGKDRLKEYLVSFGQCSGITAGADTVFLKEHYQDLCPSETKDEMEEFMFLGLRLMRGVSKEDFRKRFHMPMERVYGEVLKKYRQNGLLIEQGDRLYLSDAGIDVSNVIMSEFIIL